MPISVKYFAVLRERMGRGEDLLEPDEAAATVAGVWARVSDGKEVPNNILMAVNMEYVGPEHVVKDGDEVAFFPPVTGG